MSICICGAPRSGEHCHACDVTHPDTTQADRIEALEAQLEESLRLARTIVNSWASVARAKRDIDYIARCHKSLDALQGRTIGAR